MASIKPAEISQILRQQLEGLKLDASFEEVGSVLQVGDGIARIYGLSNVQSNELVEFDNGVMGIVFNLEEDNVGTVLLGPSVGIGEGSHVKRSRRIASIRVGEGLLGRVINTIGDPLDGKGPITGELIDLPLERKAPGVIFRQPVNQPLQTGIKAIDAMIPIGRGQRELIIGDRQTGKTAIAIDTIINQRQNYEKGKPVYCIYVAIGQKGSTVAQIAKTFEEHGAMPYTVIVMATASDPAALQFYAPFAGAAIGEFFRDTGRDALIVYDDLSKQAVSYREVSLLLRRPPGREAYPGDVFYLHSRLLERAAKVIDSDEVAARMNDLPEVLRPLIKGGGSLTALPIIETQAGDISAYIPTNVISITDGQIFLESGLFNSGIRPAINVGISVSRVGGAAQIKAMKKVAGSLKLDQAQYRELEAFSKFGSDLDSATLNVLGKGARNVEILKQNLHNPYSVEEQIAILFCGTRGLLFDVPVREIREFESEFLEYVKMKYPEMMEELRNGQITDKSERILTRVVSEMTVKYRK
ncbi:MAG: F0F1 ATP synthase subunit alpha [Bacteroidales bacterium]